MDQPRERFFWVIAVSLSIAAHIALALLISGFTVRPDVRPIMKVRFVTMEKKNPANTAPLKQNEPAEKKKIQPKEVLPSKKPQEHPNPVKNKVSTAEKTVVPEVQPQGDSQTKEADSLSNKNISSGPANDIPGKVVPSLSEKIVELNTIEVLRKILPNYSAFSRKRKEEGTVNIIATVTDGRVISTEVESSSGYPRLDESALRAVSQWMFKNRGTIRVRVPINFKLN